MQTGSPLCLVVNETTDSYSIIEADNIAIENWEVAADVIRYISDENGSAEIPRRFKSPAYWRFTLTSTDGNKRAAWWKVGEHTSLTSTMYNRELPSGLDNWLILRLFAFIFVIEINMIIFIWYL